MPMLRQAMYARDVQARCAPAVDDREIWQASMRHIAYEGCTFVLSACQHITRANAPDACVQDDAPDTVLIDSGSVIVSPLGEVLAGPLLGGEGVLSAEIDLADIVRGKYDLDVIGHYARPDVFQLSVDTRLRPPCVEASAAPMPPSRSSQTP